VGADEIMADQFVQQLNQYVTRIEGHGVLKIDFDQNTAHMQVDEGERMFEAMIVGQKFDKAPWVTSRICGVCPVAHTLAAIKAVEEALRIKPELTAVRLRELLLCGQIIGSHLLHLFFLVLPDYVGVSSAVELAEKFPAEFHLALNIKRFCDKIISIVGGRVVHPVRAVPGGFTMVPTEEEIRSLSLQLEDTIDEAVNLVELFAEQEYPEFSVLEDMLSLADDNSYALYRGMVGLLNGDRFDPRDLENNIQEEVRNYSSAKFSFLKNKTYFTGALTRLNLSSGQLAPRAKNLYNQCFSEEQLNNPFYNNLAQAIEIVHCYEEAEKLIEWLIEESDLQSGLVRPFSGTGYSGGRGVGCVEAPRGLLYHRVNLNENFLIDEYNIITPTSQNVANLEVTCQQLIEKYRDKSDEEKKKLVQMLIRAYDPCLTCSVH